MTSTQAHTEFLLGKNYCTESQRQGCVYVIRNLKNGKSYVGKTLNETKRWTMHLSLAKRGSQQLIHKALRKYGVTNFSFEVIHRCAADDLDALETASISRLRTHATEGGYNLTQGGDGGLMSHAVRLKMSRSAKARMQRPGEREKVAAHQRRLWQDPAYAANFAAAVTGKVATKSTRRKMSATHKANWANADEATKLHKSKCSKAALASAEARAAHSTRLRAVLATPEARALKSFTSKKMWKDPAFRMRMAASHARRRAEKEASLV